MPQAFDEQDERHFRRVVESRARTAREELEIVDQDIEEVERLIEKCGGRDGIASHDPFLADAVQSVEEAISDVRQFEATFDATFANVE